MPEIEIQDLIVASSSDLAHRARRIAKRISSQGDLPVTTANGAGAEEHALDWQRLWIDLGGEG